MAGFLLLAVETRLQIYEYLLDFSQPLKRVQLQGASQHPREPPATSILLVNRQVHLEALPTFYKLNTIRISHNDVCLWNVCGRSTSCDTSLLHRAILNDSSVWTPFSNCGRCGADLYGFVNHLNGDRFPKLRDLTINVTGSDSVAELKRQLQQPKEDAEQMIDAEAVSAYDDVSEPSDVEDDAAWANHYAAYDQNQHVEDCREVERDLQQYMNEGGTLDMDIDFTAPGRFKVVAVTVPKLDVNIVFQFPDIARTWDYYQGLPIGHPHLAYADQYPPSLKNVRGALRRTIQSMIAGRAEWIEHAACCELARNTPMSVPCGDMLLHASMLGPGEGCSEMYEEITHRVVELM